MSSGAVDAEAESGEAETEVEADVCCANCGIAQVDDIKLKECDGCQSVRYCSDICQENHREQHEEDCEKRKAELHDKELFEQPEESHLGECPLCFIPIPLDLRKSLFHSCCCKLVCLGCDYADYLSNGRNRCPFCREPVVNGDEHIKRVMERVKANDPAALSYMGKRRIEEGDYDKAFEYWTKAAELGYAAAHNNLGLMYYKGEGVEKDDEKAIHHYENAAIEGHPGARHNLGCMEGENDSTERAMKHFIIAANLGLEDSMKMLWKYYSAGCITKEELESTLRSHKAAIDATKSSEREAAEAYFRGVSAS
jgi:tetratricopeptide (TPR) repeat protein